MSSEMDPRMKVLVSSAAFVAGMISMAVMYTLTHGTQPPQTPFWWTGPIFFVPVVMVIMAIFNGILVKIWRGESSLGHQILLWVSSTIITFWLVWNFLLPNLLAYLFGW